ncbi:MAG: aldolase/citrate lyase family protein, partial [Pseudomonadota bacterium]
MGTRTPRQFFQPLAAGAPAPLHNLPTTLERMIHFVPPHLDKVRGKVPAMAETTDVILANLEDAIPADAKEAARAGAIEIARMLDWQSSDTGFWSRVNPLNSPWFLDDVTELVLKAGHQLDVLMIPKVEGPFDIHYVDQLLAQLEAKAELKRPILLHAILETAEGVARVEEIALASPRMQGISLGPADLAASRKMKTTRVGGGHPFYRVIEDPREDEAPRASAQQDPWHYTLAR